MLRSVLRSQGPNDDSGVTSYQCVRGDIRPHDRTGSYNRSLSNMYALQNGALEANPYVIFNCYRPGSNFVKVNWLISFKQIYWVLAPQVAVQGVGIRIMNIDQMCNQYTISNFNKLLCPNSAAW